MPMPACVGIGVRLWAPHFATQVDR